MANNEVTRVNYRGLDWLGFDLVLVDGDFVFGEDGDLKVHSDPVESFAQCLKHRVQVACNEVYSTKPSDMPIITAIAMDAIRSDPRVSAVRIQKKQFLAMEGTGQVNPQFLELTVSILLKDHTPLENLVLPIFLKGNQA